MKHMRYWKFRWRFIWIFTLTLAFTGILASCSRGYPRQIRLPSDPSVHTDLGWALVTTAYAKMKTSPSKTSSDSGFLPSGTIFILKERKIDPDGQDVGGFWYLYYHKDKETWIHEKDMAIFPTEGQAVLAAQNFSQPDTLER